MTPEERAELLQIAEAADCEHPRADEHVGNYYQALEEFVHKKHALEKKCTPKVIKELLADYTRAEQAAIKNAAMVTQVQQERLDVDRFLSDAFPDWEKVVPSEGVPMRLHFLRMLREGSELLYKERNEARDFAEDLARRAREVTCAWCGHQFETTLGEQVDAIRAHAEQCPEHPVAAYRATLTYIRGWCKSYPLTAFPEPDMDKARDALRAAGLSLDAVSASAMRHVLSGIEAKVNAALAGEKPWEKS